MKPNLYLTWLLPMALFALWFAWHEGYIGWTEAPTQRSIVSVLKEDIDVRDFGAVGDGVTDDTMAVQYAINAAHEVGKPVIFPPGTYSIRVLSPRGVPTTGPGILKARLHE